jgi:nucleotide-binding universal stress UspA family protein
MTAPDNDRDAANWRPQRTAGPILAGVTPGQQVAVVHKAAELAAGLGVELVCAYVDTTTYEAKRPDGSSVLLPIDPDSGYDDVEQIADQIRASLGKVLDGSGVAWSFRDTAGEPARTLAGVAEQIGACIIVVGTREAGLAHRIEEMFAGSVATHLAHHQPRPVLVVPLNPRPFGQQA